MAKMTRQTQEMHSELNTNKRVIYEIEERSSTTSGGFMLMQCAHPQTETEPEEQEEQEKEQENKIKLFALIKQNFLKIGSFL